MRRHWVIFLLLAAASVAQAQTFNDFINHLDSIPETDRAAVVDSFMNAIDNRAPYLEFDTLCHFIYRGSATSVGIYGDMNEWGDPVIALSKVSGTDFWYANRIYEADARLDYKLVVNGNWILDPLNPYQMPGGFGPNSELRMPAYVFPEEVNYLSPNPGTVSSYSLASDTLIYGNPRPYKI
ncbi:MAG: hypothetical protein V2A56_11625 [bacterium]